jgi:hypothetical protein
LTARRAASLAASMHARSVGPDVVSGQKRLSNAVWASGRYCSEPAVLSQRLGVGAAGWGTQYRDPETRRSGWRRRSEGAALVECCLSCAGLVRFLRPTITRAFHEYRRISRNVHRGCRARPLPYVAGRHSSRTFCEIEVNAHGESG